MSDLKREIQLLRAHRIVFFDRYRSIRGRSPRQVFVGGLPDIESVFVGVRFVPLWGDVVDESSASGRNPGYIDSYGFVGRLCGQ